MLDHYFLLSVYINLFYITACLIYIFMVDDLVYIQYTTNITIKYGRFLKVIMFLNTRCKSFSWRNANVCFYV